MPFVVPAILAAASGISGLLANRKKQTQQQQQTSSRSVQNSSGTSSSSSTSSTAPVYDPATLAMRNALLKNFSSRIDAGGIDKILGGQLAQQLAQANQGSSALRAATTGRFAASGLGNSPALQAVLAQQDAERVANQIGLMNQFPLLREQFIQSRLGQASDFFKGLPVGSTTTNNSTTNTSTTGTTDTTGNSTGTVTDPGNPLAGLVDNLFTTLAGLYGQGAFNSAPKAPAAPSFVKTNPSPNFRLVPPIVGR